MISVAMCTYNGEKFIEKQLNSILNQTVFVDQIIVCDDCSKDNTISIIKTIIKNTNIDIKIFVNETNKGVTKNFERALSLCDGDFIFLADQDDIWHPHKVEKILDAFKKNPDCKLVFTDAYLIDANDKYFDYSLWDSIEIKAKTNYTINDFLGKRFVTGATVAIKKELLAHTLPIPECWLHDAWLAINTPLNGNVCALEEKLISYRQHDKNVIGAKKRTLINQIRYTISNISKSIAFRNIMFDRFTCFLAINEKNINDEVKEEINRCIGFWRDSKIIQESSLSLGLKIIFLNLCKKYYSKFNNGYYGAIVDFMILIKSVLNL